MTRRYLQNTAHIGWKAIPPDKPGPVRCELGSFIPFGPPKGIRVALSSRKGMCTPQPKGCGMVPLVWFDRFACYYTCQSAMTLIQPRFPAECRIGIIPVSQTSVSIPETSVCSRARYLKRSWAVVSSVSYPVYAGLIRQRMQAPWMKLEV